MHTKALIFILGIHIHLTYLHMKVTYSQQSAGTQVLTRTQEVDSTY